MENKAQSLIKILIIILLIAGCTFRDSRNFRAGGIIVNCNDTHLMRKNGRLYYDGLLFTGKVNEYYSTGEFFCETEYLNGREDGNQNSYYETGRLKETRNYVNGKKEGTHFGWWENGNWKFIFNFENDVYEGNEREWNKYGMLFTDFNYVKGYEEGLQRMWYADGTLQANYVVKNNRKYGLTGVKNCQTVNENEKEN